MMSECQLSGFNYEILLGWVVWLFKVLFIYLALSRLSYSIDQKNQ